MMLPDITPLTSNTATVAEFKTALTNLRLYLLEQFGASGAPNQTLDNLGASFSTLITCPVSTTVLASASGSIYNFTSSTPTTCTLNPISTNYLAGFHVIVKNSGTSTVTILASDTINGISGATGIELGPDSSVIIFADNSLNKWFTFGGLYSKYTKIGYNTGGTVSQAGTRTTGVTLHTLSGAITLVSDILNAGAVSSFTLTNNKIEANDIIVVHRKSSGTNEKYNIWVDSVSAGSCKISIRNFTTTNSVNEVVVISFAVIKGAIS